MGGNSNSLCFVWPKKDAGETDKHRGTEQIFTGCPGITGNCWVGRNYDPLKDVQTVYWEDPEETL